MFIILIKVPGGVMCGSEPIVSATEMQPQELCQPQFLFQPQRCVSHNNDRCYYRMRTGVVCGMKVMFNG